MPQNGLSPRENPSCVLKVPEGSCSSPRVCRKLVIKTKGKGVLFLDVFLSRYMAELAPKSSLASTEEDLWAWVLCASLALGSAFGVNVPAVSVASRKVPKHKRPHSFPWKRLRQSCSRNISPGRKVGLISIPAAGFATCPGVIGSGLSFAFKSCSFASY